MLKKVAVTLCAVVLMTAGGVSTLTAANASPSSGGCDTDVFAPTCDIVIDQPGTPGEAVEGPGGSEASPGEFSPGPSSCGFAGAEVPCSTDAGTWTNDRNCTGYVDLKTTQPAPPAGRDAGVGAWYQCTAYCPPGQPIRSCYSVSFWSDTPPAGIARYTPAQAAAMLVKTFQLRGITIGMAPAELTHDDDPAGTPGYRRTWVGIPVWLWVSNPEPLSFGPYTETATLGGVTVTATASVSSVTWDSGDGQTVTCGSGTKFDLAAAADQLAIDSPTCGFRYQHASAPEGATVTATSHWSVNWSGGGTDGTIAVRDTSTTTFVRVGELQSVNTNLTGARR